MTAASPAQALSPARGEHIVDTLILERAPRLSASMLWPVLRPLLYRLLDYRKARRMADALAPLGGREALDYASRLLSLQLSAKGLAHAPRSGPLIVVCNHPTGIADGIAVYDALKGVRPDLCFYANADARRVAPRLDEVLIPVEWVEAKRTRERLRLTLQLTKAALAAGRCLVIFPAGRMARRAPDGGLSDPPWAPTPVSLARRHEAPILPLHVAGPWSRLFHVFNRFSPELRDITLFHEMLNKERCAYALTAGPAIPPQALTGEAAEITARLKSYVERLLPRNPDQAFA